MLPLLSSVPLPRQVRPVLIVWLFVGIIACLLGLTVYSSDILSAGRAYVATESERAKSQKDAVVSLLRFASEGQEEDYLAYERALGRIEKARHHSRFPFPSVLPTGRIEELSRRSAGLMELVGDVARGLRERTLAGAEASQRLHRLNLRLSPLEDEFAAEVDALMVTGHSILTSGILVITGLLLIAGIALSARFIAQNEKLQQTLAENETQLRHMVEAAPLPLLIVRASDQRLMYVNERALEQFGLDVDGALTRSMSDFHVDGESRARLSEAVSREGSARDFELKLRDVQGKEIWMLLSAQAIRYQGTVCLLVALADIDARKRLQDDMRRKAMHDPLTGLPNRAMFMEALERAVAKARRRATRFSVVFIDLDHFKEVNDTMGHHAGDALLQELARRLAAAVRQSDMVARLSGDEFVVLVEEQGGPEEVMIVAQKALVALSRPVMIDWREAKVSGSIGIASYPDDGADVPELVKNADTAMYQAKERGRNNFQFYSAEQNELSRHRFEQEKRLRGALERGEFFLEYQPEIDLATGRPVAVEALVRWRDPTAGVVLPGIFLPIAEETGMATALGTWVLHRALADLRSWIEAGIELQLSINLSERQLQQPELAEELQRLLDTYDIPPARVRLEINEPTLLEHAETVLSALQPLDSLGVEIVIDNFGTGYSSLGLVRGLPIRAVKIDKSLVSYCPSKRECAAIVQAASTMARVLGIRVIAGGVETEEQREAMVAMGCDSMQGYLAARPVDAAGIAAMMRAAAEQTLFA
jgi:diguanylate cyclase (GGDEF)-like protein/PAS domain S-box-containing protein